MQNIASRLVGRFLEAFDYILSGMDASNVSDLRQMCPADCKDEFTHSHLKIQIP